MAQCTADPCSVTKCAAFPNAQCTANYCGGCHAIFSDDYGNPVNCGETSSSTTAPLVVTSCPPDKPMVACFANPCSVTKCAAFPNAQCTAEFCGGCHAIFSDDYGNPVNCAASTRRACTVSEWQWAKNQWPMDPSESFSDVFKLPKANVTLWDALTSQGRTKYDSLRRQAVAALLNAARDDFNSGHTTAEVIALVKNEWRKPSFKHAIDLLLEGNSVGNCPI